MTKRPWRYLGNTQDLISLSVPPANANLIQRKEVNRMADRENDENVCLFLVLLAFAIFIAFECSGCSSHRIHVETITEDLVDGKVVKRVTDYKSYDHNRLLIKSATSGKVSYNGFTLELDRLDTKPDTEAMRAVLEGVMARWMARIEVVE